jgi:monofunctional biosynthetic peptidoglycan transglycosylase
MDMGKVRVRKVIKAGLFILPAALLLAVGCSFVFPRVSDLEKQNPQLTSLMKFRIKQARARGRSETINQTWVPFSKISPHLVYAVIIAEDDKFWGHRGFDLEAIRTALEKNLKKKTWRYGGSTITQQLAKNLYLSPSKNPLRKLREFLLAWRLERALTKKRILELYLNVVEWGDGIYGAEAASRQYYGKSAAGLDPIEAAHLAVVLPNPRRYNPLGGTKYIENQASKIHSIMVKRGLIRSADGITN